MATAMPPVIRSITITSVRTGDDESMNVIWQGMTVLEVLGSLRLAEQNVILSHVKGGVTNGDSATAETVGDDGEWTIN